MGQTVNSHWATNTREHSPDFREHPLDPRKPPNTTQKPENTWRTTNDPEGPSPRGTYKRRKRKRKRYVIHSRKDSHWERLLTWASERNRRYPRRPTEARCPRYPYRYRKAHAARYYLPCQIVRNPVINSDPFLKFNTSL